MMHRLKRRWKSFGFAFKGLADMLRTQPNARFHTLAAGLVIAAGLYVNLSTIEWCLISLAIALVFAAEAFNTALEYLVDLTSPHPHPLAGKAKDAAAAAVLLTALGAAVLGILIFGPKI
ncbi:MAG: diacylglycerol kinase family protein [Saprospiraceae bacterium]|nr:diacylglycerol kinase family protein [Saprospiraceae bacterium]